MDAWIAQAVGLMHVTKISNMELAKHMGVSHQYISEILNGKKTPKDAESRIMTAINDIISERK